MTRELEGLSTLNARIKKVIIIGLDGFEPTITETMLRTGELPNMARIRQAGGYARVLTTPSAQTPVAWSTFATGTNPGGHGIFDFVHRDPKTYYPTLSLNRYVQKNAFTMPRAINMRRGTTMWALLSAASIPSVVLRHPCTYPPDELRGRMLAGLGVPDLRGGLGTTTFYAAASDIAPGENESVVPVRVAADFTVATHLIGPRNPRDRSDFTTPITIRLDPAGRRAVLHSEGQPRELALGEGCWSDWLKVKFRTGPLMSVRGMVRFFLVQAAPVFQLHASPVNFDPDAPLFPISAPADYAAELAAKVGPFHTTGMVEDYGGLNNGRFDEAAYLEHCASVMAERQRMMTHELDRFVEGLFYCLLDTPDRLSHMFWRFREPTHPANTANPLPVAEADRRDLARAIEEHCRQCDAVVGSALAHTDDRTLLIVLSDHGMSSFQRGLHLNTWLHENGFMAFKKGIEPGAEAGDFLKAVDWSRTKAYALGLGSIYLNLRGREANGIVEVDDADQVKAEIVRGLTGLRDPERSTVAVRSVATREQVFSGAYVEESPDLLVNFARGYRVSWGTPLGGAPAGLFEDNTKRWGGDHAVDPALVPGVLFMNRPFDSKDPSLADLAPTILEAFGAPKGPAMEGRSLLV
jgi:predicted AlkP superfamily phosphohydrolase/phosphomutase